MGEGRVSGWSRVEVRIKKKKKKKGEGRKKNRKEERKRSWIPPMAPSMSARDDPPRRAERRGFISERVIDHFLEHDWSNR